MPTQRVPGKFARVRLEPPVQWRMDLSPRDWIAHQISPGQSVERYRRTWMVGKTFTLGSAIYGRIGYEGNPSQFEVYDEERQDFVGVTIRTGNVTPFVINLETFMLAFQIRPPEIVAGSVAGAVAAMLSDDELRWSVDSLTQRVSLETWRQNIDRVRRIRFTFTKANPHYQDADDLEHLIEQAHADLGRLELQADSGAGLDLSSPFLEQTLRHVNRGYGDARLTGVDVNGNESVYSTSLNAVENILEAPTDDATGEIWQASLGEAVAEHPSTSDTE